jgi:hypothetical protein
MRRGHGNVASFVDTKTKTELNRQDAKNAKEKTFSIILMFVGTLE